MTKKSEKFANRVSMSRRGQNQQRQSGVNERDLSGETEKETSQEIEGRPRGDSKYFVDGKEIALKSRKSEQLLANKDLLIDNKKPSWV